MQQRKRRPQKSASDTCPKCGYCDKCGRSNAAPYVPYVPYVPQVEPWWQPNVTPYYPWPVTITWGTTTTSASINCKPDPNVQIYNVPSVFSGTVSATDPNDPRFAPRGYDNSTYYLDSISFDANGTMTTTGN